MPRTSREALFQIDLLNTLDKLLLEPFEPSVDRRLRRVATLTGRIRRAGLVIRLDGGLSGVLIVKQRGHHIGVDPQLGNHLPVSQLIQINTPGATHPVVFSPSRNLGVRLRFTSKTQV